jgi:CRP/FNR family transcriptional regulator, cyclic AMP receptor protein
MSTSADVGGFDKTQRTTSQPRAEGCSNRRPQIKRDRIISAARIGGEGSKKLRERLISHGLIEDSVDELIGRPTLISYRRGSFIFVEGNQTDFLFWVSNGLVDILCAGENGEQIIAAVLGPGDLFGYVESTNEKGRPVQAYQARARTNVTIGLVIRERIYKVLAQQDTTVLVHIIGEIVRAWSQLTIHNNKFLGQDHDGRFNIVLANLARKFGVKDSRGVLLVPEFRHSDFAEMIGSSRPMITRLISKMISVGRLAQHGKQYIVLDHFDIDSDG